MTSTDGETVKTEGKTGSVFKVVIILILIVIPLSIFLFIYSRGGAVKRATDKGLAKLPGPVGNYFKHRPTEAEKEFRVDYLSEYFLAIDDDKAADKLYIIKKDDEALYSDIVKSMNSINAEESEEIILKVRGLELRKDLLTSSYDEAREDEDNQFRSEISQLESKDLLNSKMELERKFSDRDFQKVLSEISSDKIAEIFYYTDIDIKSYLMNTFKNKKRMEIEESLSEINNEKNSLKDLAKYYETKPGELALESIGNKDNYSIDKLAIIYKNMSIFKSSEILSQVEDDEFIEELFKAIRIEEKLSNSELNITKDISRSIEFLSEYDEKIQKLQKVYEDMDPRHIGRIAEKMIKNDKSVTIFNLDIQESFYLSDKVIVIDILSGLKRDTLSKVLDSMKEEEAALLTQLLAKPTERIPLEGGERIDVGQTSNKE